MCSHFGTKSRRLRSCVRKCDYSGMGMRRIEPGRLNAALVAILREELGARGWSVRQLAERSGIPRTRTHGTLVGERPLNVDELTAFCGALELTAWRVVRRAEAPASPAAYAEAAFAKLDEVTARDYAPAASPRDGDPYEPAD